MKRIAVLIIILLAGSACTCLAEEWYVIEEASSYDFVSFGANLILAKEETNPRYTPFYSDKERERAALEINKYSEAVKTFSDRTAITKPDIPVGGSQGSPPHGEDNTGKS